MSRSPQLSRRDLLFGRFRAGVRLATDTLENKPQTTPADGPTLAVIQGRHCLAYRGLMCSTCFERCPEQGAIVIEQGVPRIDSDKCTGCGDCREVCPAPTNAVLLTRPRNPIKRGDA